MKKNAFLTFVFACIPGAGQMYYGYMLRGLSLITMFVGCFMLGNLASPLIALFPIVWMYSFFDTYDLIRYMAAGEPKKDGLLLIGDVDAVKKLIPQHGKLIGWGLIALGVYALYELVVGDWLRGILIHVFGYGYVIDFLNSIPTMVVAILLIFGGVKMLGMHPAKKEELPPYPQSEEEQEK